MRIFDLCGLLKDQLLENVQLSKMIGCPFKFGTLVICLVMYFLNCLPLINNVICEESEPIFKKIYIHSNNLENYDQEYESFFKGLLGKFGSIGISFLVRALNVGSSSGEI